MSTKKANSAEKYNRKIGTIARCAVARIGADEGDDRAAIVDAVRMILTATEGLPAAFPPGAGVRVSGARVDVLHAILEELGAPYR